MEFAWLKGGRLNPAKQTNTQMNTNANMNHSSLEVIAYHAGWRRKRNKVSEVAMNVNEAVIIVGAIRAILIVYKQGERKTTKQQHRQCVGCIINRDVMSRPIVDMRLSQLWSEMLTIQLITMVSWRWLFAICLLIINVYNKAQQSTSQWIYCSPFSVCINKVQNYGLQKHLMVCVMRCRINSKQPLWWTDLLVHCLLYKSHNKQGRGEGSSRCISSLTYDQRHEEDEI